MKTWYNANKADWPSGPWQSEPDRAQWIDDATGLDCLITRSHWGNLCGYVGVPESHALFGRDYQGLPIAVHGGVTFAGPCDPGEAADSGICHTGDVANETVWWFGFDCAHGYDKKPAVGRMLDPLVVEMLMQWSNGETYRDFPYVVDQVAKLAAQLAVIARPASNDGAQHG